MADFSSSGPSNPFNSSRSGSSNPFVGPSVTVIRYVPVLERVPIKLSHTAANFFTWKMYFALLFREYDILDHINDTVDLLAMPHDPDWSTIDATIIRWFFQTISTDIFHTVVRDGDTARDVWKKITGLFTDNKIQRITFLQQEFFGLHQNDLSLNAFCLRLKTLSDELRDLEFPITDALLLSMLAAGLGEDLSHVASNLTLLTTPTYEQVVAYLRNEERRLKHLRAHAAHTAFVAGFFPGVPSPTGLPPRAWLPTTRPSCCPPPFGPADKTSSPTAGGFRVCPLLLPRAAMAAASVDAVVAATVATAMETRLLPSSPHLRHPGPRANIPGPELSTPTPCRCTGPHTPASWSPDQQPTRRSPRRLNLARFRSTPHHPATTACPRRRRLTPRCYTPSTLPPTLARLVAPVTSGSWTAVPPPT
jgi:hypothetical protein